MFNLNDPRWGRGDDDKPSEDNRARPRSGRTTTAAGPNQGPPDLDELWRDFNRKLGGLFGGAARRRQGGGGGGGGGGNFQPDMKSAGVGAGLIAAVVVLIWLGTGFFIVQEGQQAVITQFGKYKSTVGAGFNWRLPYPIQRHEIVNVTQIRSVDVGRDTVIRATGLKESAMLTEDENILDDEVLRAVPPERRARLAVRKQGPAERRGASRRERRARGRRQDAHGRGAGRRARPDRAARAHADAADPRPLQGRRRSRHRQHAAGRRASARAGAGGFRRRAQGRAGARARQERSARLMPTTWFRAPTALRSRLAQEADGYKSRIVAQAEGDAQRFKSVLAEYQRAPQVTRDRLYIDTMQQIYSNVTKIVVDSRQGGNMLFLPLDKILQQLRQSGGAAAAAAPEPAAPAATPAPNVPSSANDARSRDNGRTRDRETR